MSDTPETDAEHQQFAMGGFTLDFCRKLERERDKAREDATNYYSKIGELEQERDEAREALAAAKYYLTEERDDALSQIVQAECRAERFCQERDEAREVLREIAEASGFDNIGNWARNKAKSAIYR